MQDDLGLTSDWVYDWRLLLEEYGPMIIYIRSIHNTVADAISWLDYGTVKDDRFISMTFAQCYHNSTNEQEALAANIMESMTFVFAKWSKEDSIYPLTTRDIAKTQQQDHNLQN